MTIGSLPCAVSSEDDSSITCAIARKLSGGSNVVLVLVDGKGYASPFTFDGELTVTDVTSDAGTKSLGGGNFFSITGSGFGGKQETNVKIGNLPCTVTDTTWGSINCHTEVSTGAEDVADANKVIIIGMEPLEATMGRVQDDDKMSAGVNDDVCFGEGTSMDGACVKGKVDAAVVMTDFPYATSFSPSEHPVIVML